MTASNTNTKTYQGLMLANVTRETCSVALLKTPWRNRDRDATLVFLKVGGAKTPSAFRNYRPA